MKLFSSFYKTFGAFGVVLSSNLSKSVTCTSTYLPTYQNTAVLFGKLRVQVELLKKCSLVYFLEKLNSFVRLPVAPVHPLTSRRFRVI